MPTPYLPNSKSHKTMNNDTPTPEQILKPYLPVIFDSDLDRQELREIFVRAMKEYAEAIKPTPPTERVKDAVAFLEEEVGECHYNPNVNNGTMAEVLEKYAAQTRREELKHHKESLIEIQEYLQRLYNSSANTRESEDIKFIMGENAKMIKELKSQLQQGGG